MHVLYNVKVDDPLADNRASFYQILIKDGEDGGSLTHFVIEKHGWFDEQHQQTVLPYETLREPFSTLKEAHIRKDQQVKHRISEGFVHSYQIDYYGDNLGAPIYELMVP